MREFTEIARRLTETVQQSAAWAEEVRPESAAARIRGIGTTGFVPALTLLDSEGFPLRPAILHTDTRAAAELTELRKNHGLNLTLGTLLPKLLWVRRNEPDSFSRARTVMGAHSYLAYRLTGSVSTDYDTASIFGGIFDTEACSYKTDLCEDLELSRDLFPPAFPATGTVGRVTDAAAKETGIPAGTPVIAGTGDSFASLLGDGVLRRGEAMVYLGTSGTVIFLENDASVFMNTSHFGPGKAQFLGRIFSCGESLETVRNLSGGKSWEELNRQAADVPPGSGGLLILPHLKQKTGGNSPATDGDTVFGLRPQHSPFHLYRALLEGIAARIRERLESKRGELRRIVCTGGGAESSLFRLIISSMTGLPVHYNPEGSAALGAALLAACALENSGGAEQFTGGRLSAEAITRPESSWEKTYDTFYKTFLRYQQGVFYEKV